MTRKIVPVLLCGGFGTRLWPLSRKSYPKQFSKLIDQETLFQASAKRLSGPSFSAPLVMTADPFRFIVTEQLEAIGTTPAGILIEPIGRDTAPAVIAAALHVYRSDPEAVILVAPSDHVIPDTDHFRTCVLAALPQALNGKLVTFGIAPDRPETGYGYLELSTAPNQEVSPVPLKGFVEKPNEQDAATMIASGRFLWNAGIFLFSAQAIISAFETHAPEILAGVRKAVEHAKSDLGFTRLDPDAWDTVESNSLDYAIMEKSDNLSVVPYDKSWSDLGDWAAVWRETQVDGIATEGPATALDCSGTLLRSETDGQEIIGIGLKDIVAIAMPDAVLVAHKDHVQSVKQAVSTLRTKQVPQAETFPKDHRPWGWFESLVIGGRFQVKRIHVHPGAALSLQSHHHRSEHWIVVEGTAKVTVDEEVKLISENQSVYIPLGAVHRMENPGKLPMVLIEVQTGSYLGEDDIIRYEDVYARE